MTAVITISWVTTDQPYSPVHVLCIQQKSQKQTNPPVEGLTKFGLAIITTTTRQVKGVPGQWDDHHQHETITKRQQK